MFLTPLTTVDTRTVPKPANLIMSLFPAWNGSISFVQFTAFQPIRHVRRASKVPKPLVGLLPSGAHQQCLHAPLSALLSPHCHCHFSTSHSSKICSMENCTPACPKCGRCVCNSEYFHQPLSLPATLDPVSRLPTCEALLHISFDNQSLLHIVFEKFQAILTIHNFGNCHMIVMPAIHVRFQCYIQIEGQSWHQHTILFKFPVLLIICPTLSSLLTHSTTRLE